MAANYDTLNTPLRNSPYGSGDPYYNESSGYITPHRPPKKTVSKWVKFGIPVAIVVIAAAVLGGVLGSRGSKNSSSAAAQGSAAATSAISVKNDLGHFPTATDSQYLVPIYPMTVSFLFVTIEVLLIG
jgi:hypothetical protein